MATPRAYPGLSTGKVGAVGELRVATDLLIKGYDVGRAIRPACSCGLVALKNDKCVRIEVRTGFQYKTVIGDPKHNVRAEQVAVVLPGQIIYTRTA
jgi:hypothetical protein